jgi:methionyl-tRNA synthetase
MTKFYITCAIPYVNAAPHIGHALEFVQGDVIARYHRLRIGNENVKLLSGGDENALKNVQAAQAAGVPVQQFIDENNTKFFELTIALGCQFDIWQKGSDTVHHFPSSQKLWDLCTQNVNEQKESDIYSKSYEGLYCVGCEAFYTPDELNENGECFEHPGKKLEIVKETNYFFRLSRYQKRLINIIRGEDKEFTLHIVPDKRKHEVLSFLERGLEDISISRSNERAKNWGVPVPGDDTQRMYVWFDALNIYQSGIGFGWDDREYKKWWPADVHVIGKGITRFHAIYWPAFLLSAGLNIPKKLFVHEYFTVNGQKMSKTLGNVIDPKILIQKYGADPLRYYFVAKFSPFNDGDFSEEEFKKTYNADLANGLGNLTARVAKMAEGIIFDTNQEPDISKTPLNGFGINYQFDITMKNIFENIRQCDVTVNEKQLWNLKGNEKQEILQSLIHQIRIIGYSLQPFLPKTAEKILRQFAGPTIQSEPPLFPRII